MCDSQFKRGVGEVEEHTDLWIGYCAFHLGDYKRAMEVRLPFLSDSVEYCSGVFSELTRLSGKGAWSTGNRCLRLNRWLRAPVLRDCVPVKRKTDGCVRYFPPALTDSNKLCN